MVAIRKKGVTVVVGNWIRLIDIETDMDVLLHWLLLVAGGFIKLS